MILQSFLSKRKKYGEKKYRMEDVTMKKDKEATRTGSYEKKNFFKRSSGSWLYFCTYIEKILLNNRGSY